MTRTRTLVALSALGLSAALLAGCTGGADAAPGATGGTSQATPTDALPQPTATDEATPIAVTCDTLVDPDTLVELQDQGWTAKESPFVVSDRELTGGIQCDWADYSTESGNVITLAWAPIGPEDAEWAKQALITEGWLSESDEDGTYITDPGGFGLTYLFGDGWVEMSDNRQQLLLIQRPQA